MLGPKEFREVLRYLAMDEPPLLSSSSNTAVEVATPGSRKRKFVEVQSDTPDEFGNQLYKLGTLMYCCFCLWFIYAEVNTVILYYRSQSRHR